MPTLTPTSNGGSGPSAAFPDAGPLDLGVLTALASQFFQALPGVAHGGVAAPVNVLPGGTSTGPLTQGPALPGTIAPGANLVPTSSQSGSALVASAPALVPHAAAPNGLPKNAAIVPPAVDSRFGGHSLGVPHAGSTPATPSGPQPSAPAGISQQNHLLPGRAPSPPSTPFYFLEETPSLPVQPHVAPKQDHLSARTFQMPQDGDLRDLLTDTRRSHEPAAQPQQGYYFLPKDTTAEGRGVPQVGRGAYPAFDVNAVRRDFPILRERVNGRPLVWFDNAATTQKPQSVIDRVSYFYEHENSNIHRAAHELAARATDAYEKAREKVRAFIGASSVEECIFVRGTTEAINLIAKTWGVKHVGPGDEIIVSHLEHHANIVPWQQLAAQVGAKMKVIPVDDSGQVLLEEYKNLLTDRTKIVSVTQVSNALGTVVPVKEIVELAHRAGARALVDGAQSVSHMRVNVQDIGADFFVFSGHKIFGPTGIGVVYGKRELLDDMPPWQGGGNMIADVTFERTVFQPPPNKFEAGTGNIADAVGLGAALDYVQRIGLEVIDRYEHDLLAYATHHLAPINGVRLVGTAKHKASVLSFVLAGYSTEEVGRALNEEGIAVRSGHHCAQPILRRMGLEATVRPSLAFYNTCEEVDRFIAVVQRLSRARR